MLCLQHGTQLAVQMMAAWLHGQMHSHIASLAVLMAKGAIQVHATGKFIPWGVLFLVQAASPGLLAICAH